MGSWLHRLLTHLWRVMTLKPAPYQKISFSCIIRNNNEKFEKYLKALANEDTLLRTYCCPLCFLGCANWETFVADAKCFWTKSETLFVSRSQRMLRAQANEETFVSATMCRQQCVLVCQGLKVKCYLWGITFRSQMYGDRCFLIQLNCLFWLHAIESPVLFSYNFNWNCFQKFSLMMCFVFQRIYD